MSKCGRLCISAFMACAVLLVFTADTYPSYNAEAGRKYAVARQRVVELKRSSKKKKYRSYWIDCIRTFELVEKKYPSSPSAASACFDRADLYLDLYRFNKRTDDMESAIQVFGKCQESYPAHGKSPESLFHVVEILLEHKKDAASASKTVDKLTALYPDSRWTAKAKGRLNPAAGTRKEREINRTASIPEISSLGVVKEIRHLSGPAYTRVVIDMDRPLRFGAQELKNPDRLFFDISNARIGDSLVKEPLPVNDGILKQVRVNQHDNDTVRVVLDLASLKSYVAFPLKSPDRLVIDISGEGGETPLVSAVTDTRTQPKTEPRQESSQTTKETPESGKNNKPSLSEQFGLKIKTIAIDAGHGGHDPGAIGKGGLKEKTVTLDIAKRLAALVKARLGCSVIMTRDRDAFIQLDDRPAIARTRGADLFISIHVNANRKRKARGIETYIQGIQASDSDAMATAALENAMTTKKLSELKTEIQRFLLDLADDSKSEDSLQLAHAVQNSLVNNLKPLNRHVLDLKPVPKRAFFYVLINTEMPSILAEVGFISNPDEERLLRKDSYRQSVAEALFQGIKKFVDARYPQTAGI